MRSKLLLVALTPVLVSGCYSSSESFWSELASLSCKTQQECSKAEFDATFSSMKDCVDTVSEQGVDQSSTCEYNADQGRECIKTAKKYKNQCDLNAAEVSELNDACADLYDACLGGVGLGFDPTIGQTYISSFDALASPDADAETTRERASE